MERTLGQELRRLRIAAGYTLRKFAEEVKSSAAHQSDIEHDRRRPSEALLRRMVGKLARVGADYDSLVKLDTRLDPEVRAWANETAGVRDMLRIIRESRTDPRDVIKQIEQEYKVKKEGDEDKG